MECIVDVRLQMDLSRGESENRIWKWKQCAASGNGGKKIVSGKTKFCSTRPKCAIKIFKSGGIFTTGCIPNLIPNEILKHLMHAAKIWIESVQKTQIAEKHNMTKSSKVLCLYWQCNVRVSFAVLKGNNKDCFDMHTVLSESGANDAQMRLEKTTASVDVRNSFFL